MKKKRTFLGVLTLLILVGLVTLAFYTAATPLLGCCANCSCNCGNCGLCGGSENKDTSQSNIVVPLGLVELLAVSCGLKKRTF